MPEYGTVVLWSKQEPNTGFFYNSHSILLLGGDTIRGIHDPMSLQISFLFPFLLEYEASGALNYPDILKLDIVFYIKLSYSIEAISSKIYGWFRLR